LELAPRGRSNPSEIAKTGRFMKTTRVEAVYRIAYETFEDVAEFSGAVDNRKLEGEIGEARAVADC
jgi:hypothetical protein